jgi:hypothetical protein
VGPGELEAFPHIPSDRPTLASDDVLAEMLERATVSTPIPAPIPDPVVAVAAPGRRRASTRTVVARALFLLGFGGVLALLGYALQPRIAGAVRGLEERVPAATPTR